MDRVTAAQPDAAAQFLAGSHTSLMHGWVPLTVQLATAVVWRLRSAGGRGTGGGCVFRWPRWSVELSPTRRGGTSSIAV